MDTRGHCGINDNERADIILAKEKANNTHQQILFNIKLNKDFKLKITVKIFYNRIINKCQNEWLKINTLNYME